MPPNMIFEAWKVKEVEYDYLMYRISIPKGRHIEAKVGMSIPKMQKGIDAYTWFVPKGTNSTVFDKVKHKVTKLTAGDKVIESADMETDIVLLLVPERMHFDTDFEF